MAAKSWRAEFYNSRMRRPQSLQWLAPLALTVLGWLLAPFIDAKLKGTPLNGLPGIASFWKALLRYPIPAWAIFAAILLTFATKATIYWLRTRNTKKSDLRIVVLSSPPARWAISGKANVPYMSVSFNARFATKREHSLEIVKGYLQGTECIAEFLPIVVAWPSGCSAVVQMRVRPPLAKEGQNVTRRAILVDQFGEEHLTEPITFEWAKSCLPDLLRAIPITCFVCSKPIALEELSELTPNPAHKRCVE